MLMTPQAPDAHPFKFDIGAFEILDRAFGASRILPIDGEIRSATMPELAIDGRRLV